jgi:hypothetical protein
MTPPILSKSRMHKPAMELKCLLGLIMVFLLGVAPALGQLPITKRITIQPVQLRSSTGADPANPSMQLYEEVADRIWAQAGIDIQFLAPVTYDSDNYHTISSDPGQPDSLLGLSQVTGQPWSSSAPGMTNVVRLFFVKQIDGSNSNLGFTLQSILSIGIGNSVIITQRTAIAIADSAFTSGIVDVIAHEIGHALGLNHTTLGAGGALNLMTDGGPKTEVYTINNIFPEGIDADVLTGTIGGTSWGDDADPGTVGYQIDRARRMPVSVTITEFSYKYSQTIAFSSLSDRAYSATPFTLTATATSGLPVIFSIVSGPATLSGNDLTMTGSGVVVVKASQSGNAAYNAATDVNQSFTVTGGASGFTAWQQANFTAGELLDVNLSGPNAIYGLDGYPNLVKYALGLDPKVNATSGVPFLGVPGSDWVYTYTRPASVGDVTYTVEISTDLITWTAVGVIHEYVSTNSGTDTWRARYPLTSAANVFFRLKVVQ